MRFSKKFTILSIICIAISGCSTAYKSEGFTGGYSEKQLAEDIYSIGFKGNAYTSKDTVNEYLLRRGAELTVKNGYKYFAILSYNEDGKVREYTTPTTVSSSGYGSYSGNGNVYGNNFNWNAYSNGFSQSLITPGSTSYSVKYRNSIIIRMINSKIEAPNALNAQIILNNYNKGKQ